MGWLAAFLVPPPWRHDGGLSVSVRTLRTGALLVSVLVAVLCPNNGYAVDMADAARQMEEQRVLAVEDEYVAAELRRDEATLSRLVDDRFVYNSSSGATTDKEALIRGVLGMAMVGQTIRERTVLLEGDIALVFGTAELRVAVPGKDDAISVLRYTSTYVRRQGTWRLLALQMQPRASK